MKIGGKIMCSANSHKSTLRLEILALCICSVLAGCSQKLAPTASVIPTTELGGCVAKIDSIAWISEVKVTDLRGDKRAAIEKRLGPNIRDFVDERGCFQEVHLISEKTGEAGKEDLFLNFVFDRYRSETGIHPLGIPLSLVTLTIYVWVGGPLWYDSSEFSATLNVEDVSGRKIIRVSDQHRWRENYSFYKAGQQTQARAAYLKPGEARAVLIQKLLDEAIPEIKRYLENRSR